MDKFIIEGGKRLKGSVKINGAKNAILPIMTAALLCEGTSVMHNVPHLNDIKMMAHVLRVLGSRVSHDNDILSIDSTHNNYYEAPYELVSKMRASIYVLGPLLARFGKAKVSFPGGCAIGTRPVDLHLMVMEKLGAKITIEHGYIKATCDKLVGCEISFPKVSVGATANCLMAAVLAEGTTTIRNAAVEPEIGSLIDFLNLMGAKIKGKDESTIIVEGVTSLNPVEMEMIPDRIEAGTLVIAGAITGSEITIENCIPEHISILLEKMEQTGCSFETDKGNLIVKPAEIIKPVDIITEPYPLFPTDLQAQFMSLMTIAKGTSE